MFMVKWETPTCGDDGKDVLSNQKQYLKPKTMLKKFQALANDLLVEKREHFHEKLLTNFETDLRKIAVTLKLIWNGAKYQNDEILVDLVLCIRIAGWPNDSDVKERYNRSHPSYEMIREAAQEGYHLIASCIGELGKNSPCWRFSFSRAEGILLRHLGEMSTLEHKAAVKFLKVLRMKKESELSLYEDFSDLANFSDPDVALHYFIDKPESSYLITCAFHSYILKTMFYHEWFEYPEDSLIEPKTNLLNASTVF